MANPPSGTWIFAGGGIADGLYFFRLPPESYKTGLVHIASEAEGDEHVYTYRADFDQHKLRFLGCDLTIAELATARDTFGGMAALRMEPVAALT